MKGFMLPLIIGFLGLLLGKNGTAQSTESNEEMVFKDTLFGLFAFDSLHHNMGMVELPRPARQTCDVVKHFKYLGDEHMLFVRSRSTGPYFLFEYPKGILQKNKVYPLRFCFSHRGVAGSPIPFSRVIRLFLSDDRQVAFRFTGKYALPSNTPKGREPEKGLDTLKDSR